MRKASASLAMLGAVLVTLLACAGPAAAQATCAVTPKAKLTPYLLTPCPNVAVPLHEAVTFTVYDSNPLATKATSDRPYLNLQTSDRLQGGHLIASTDGTGIFAQLTPLAGHRDEWTLVARTELYRSWWDNHAGTCYVQIQQIEPTAMPDGIDYGPIVKVDVGGH